MYRYSNINITIHKLHTTERLDYLKDSERPLRSGIERCSCT